uniref:Putative secreted protein n=1 Tax=Anopheles darlingi TaxID=43151 RepID=A0A2M4DJ33_ANODA
MSWRSISTVLFSVVLASMKAPDIGGGEGVVVTAEMGRRRVASNTASATASFSVRLLRLATTVCWRPTGICAAHRSNSSFSLTDCCVSRRIALYSCDGFWSPSTISASTRCIRRCWLSLKCAVRISFANW